MKVSKFMKLLSLENWSNICANLQNRKTVLLLHLSNSGDLLLWVGVCRRLHLLLKNYWANLNQIWYVASGG